MARFSRARAIRQRTWLALGVILSVLLCDQVIKVAVKTNMCLHEARQVTEWFYIYFTENQGMCQERPATFSIIASTGLSLMQVRRPRLRILCPSARDTQIS